MVVLGVWAWAIGGDRSWETEVGSRESVLRTEGKTKEVATVDTRRTRNNAKCIAWTFALWPTLCKKMGSLFLFCGPSMRASPFGFVFVCLYKETVCFLFLFVKTVVILQFYRSKNNAFVVLFVFSYPRCATEVRGLPIINHTMLLLQLYWTTNTVNNLGICTNTHI